jgi:hypothetical protein
MRLIKVSGKQVVQITKSEWRGIGKQAGWIKTARNPINILAKDREQLAQLAATIMQTIESYRKLNKRLINFEIDPITVVNPYTQKNVSVPVTVRTQFGSNSIGGSATISGDIGIILPLGMAPGKKPEVQEVNPFTQQDIYGILIHEIAHVFDPKWKLPHMYWGLDPGEDGAEAYLSDPKEVDAFQAEIIHGLILGVKNDPNNINVIMHWLKSTQPIDLSPFQINRNAVTAYRWWQAKFPRLIKLLKQRVYSSLQPQIHQPIAKSRTP